MMKINKTSGGSVLKVINQAVEDSKKSAASKKSTAEDISITAPPARSALTLEDTIELSQNAKDSAKKNDKRSKLDERRNELEALRRELERINEMNEGAAEGWRNKIKALRIAMRIISGHNVPEEDHRFLREADIDLYTRAITMRIEKQDPDDYDRLSEDEEERADKAGDDSADAAAPAPEVDAGGGEMPSADVTV